MMCSYTQQWAISITITHIWLTPNPRLAETLDQVAPSKKHDLVSPPSTVTHRDTTAIAIQHLLKVFQDHRSPLIFRLSGFPGIDHEPGRCMLHGKLAHSDPVDGRCKACLLIMRRAASQSYKSMTVIKHSHRRIVARHDLICLRFQNLVFSHFKHS